MTFKRLAIFYAFVGMVSGVAGLHGQQGTVMPIPRIQFENSTGVPLAGGFLYSYAAGTTTPQQTCADNGITAGACTTPNANPVVLDSGGRATVYLLPKAYKFILQTSLGVQVWSQDNVAALIPYNQNTFTGVVTYSPSTVLTVATNAVTPTLNVHAVDTSGGAANLNTINLTSVTTPFALTLYGNNPGGNTVTVKTGAGNIVLRKGDFALNSINRYITLLLSGTTWYELDRSDIDGAVVAPELRAYSETKTTATIAANTLALDLSVGNHFAIALNANINTFTVASVAASGKACVATLYLTADGTLRTITWPTTTKWPSGTPPTMTSTNGKIDIITLLTYDGGTTWYGFVSGQNY